MTMCDVGEGEGGKAADVTHVTSAARPFQVIFRVSWLDNFHNRDHFYITTLIYYAYVPNVSKYTKNCVVIETRIDL